MSVFSRLFLAAVVLSASTTGQGAWNRASSKHFIIYSQQKPEQLRAFAEKLERFDQATRIVLKMADPTVGDGNRVTIFVLDDVAAIQKLYGRGDKFIYGFYVGRFTGPIAFTPRRADERETGGLKAESVFFHEYGHHLMFQDFAAPYPNWYVEGFAEFLSTPKFGDDGSVTVGIAPPHRAYGLFSGEGLTTQQVLESQPAKMNESERESIYGRGWLLTHYLYFEPTRRGQLVRYFNNLGKGQAMAAAAADAFGDSKQLDREMAKYVARPRLTALTVAGSALKIGRIDVSPLGTGGGEALPWRMISKRGVNPAQAQSVVAKLRPIAARQPGDVLVQVSLAEAEYDVGDHKASLVAADAALKIDPRSVEALVYKGRAHAALAAKKVAGSSFALARDAYLAANKIDPEDPEPLFLYFQSFPAEGRAPTANAISALHYASNLSPNDDGLRFNSALAWLYDKKLAEARLDLLPVAYNPHGGEAAATARAAIDRIDVKDGKGAIAAITKN